ncbi:23S rRNA (adenine(2503)-C(2))-methyltransferase RlmN [Micavibrio aeruginosavorus]|uniref:Probable dual-specificity RNA methyltransferase RlmN n=1 Tax=Micavibrio aeruginosavorus (strain ARL-13) TaxID=856793 RepID=G2KT44_MICAA|nr:23S rRNA (adenine(2503)-C(2))-methyltransferase RlmN [Micavibrio aeruginosavorus]AEP10588.1 radical SAM superfamily protein [Micavibrio aeruginosavorus ARL-13]
MSVTSHATKFAAPRTDAAGRIALIGLTLPEMIAALEEHGLPKFRAKQVWHWVYHRGVTDFEAMTNLPRDLRDTLIEKFSIERPGVMTEQKSTDGTMKWLLVMADGQQIEMVFIPEADRGTLCVSSQVGCTLTCRFCHTGTQPLVRNLGPHEILQQIMYARDVLGEWPVAGEKKDANQGRDLTNIVLMGMGEPLYNYANVAKAMQICMDEDGLGISKRRITLSTSGVVPQIVQCGEELNVNLAISLHAPNDAVRSEIMPINNKYPLAELLDACRNYPGLSDNRRITFEYVMLKDVNDSDDQARELAQLLRGIPCKVNLIPFNPWPNSPYECSSGNRIHAFARILNGEGYDAPIRKTRGQDILAACGQLKSESQRAKPTA